MTAIIIIGIIVLLGFLFEKKYTNSKVKSVGTAYFLWVFSFFGLLGFHRFYIGKYGTGFLWFFTGGCFGFGAFIDLLTLSIQVSEHNLKVNQQILNINANQSLNSQIKTQLNSYKPSAQQKTKFTNS